jgi:hypothetical protein
MNAPAKKRRPNADRRAWPAGIVVALLVLGDGQLGGCANIRRASYLPPVNPESPVAGAVAAAAKQNFKRPSFASVPPKPLNIPQPAAVKTAVIDMVRCRRAYEKWAAANPALVSGSVRFAEGLQGQLDNNPADRPTPAEEAAAEADAAKLRAFAEPPPPMHPGPPLTAADAAPPAAKTAAAAPHPPRSVVPVKTAAAAPTPAPRASQPQAVTSPPPPAPATEPAAPAAEAVAIVQPSMAPLYPDPVLAHCQGASR